MNASLRRVALVCLLGACANESAPSSSRGANANASPATSAKANAAPRYVGSRTCAACHTGQYLWWLETDHGTAFTTLQERGRDQDPECIGCHVTGAGQPTGARVGHTEELAGVGCESCHGPGGAHADEPNASPLPAFVSAATCLECHTDERSDDFVYDVARAELIVPAHGATDRTPGAQAPRAPSQPR